MDSIWRGLEEGVGGEDGANVVDFLDGEWVKRMVRGVRGMVVGGFSGLFEGIGEFFGLNSVLGGAP